MHPLVFHGPGEKAWESVPDPSIVDATDAVVRIDSSTICGTGLHRQDVVVDKAVSKSAVPPAPVPTM